VRQSSLKNSFPAGNPIANALVVIAGALVVGASIVLGFFAFIALSGIVLVSAAIIGIRVWWLKRKMERAMGEQGEHGAQRTPGAPGGVIEGEYKVVEKDHDEA
jgi:predicted lipid-binding transport protein (Tim44 family)